MTCSQKQPTATVKYHNQHLLASPVATDQQVSHLRADIEKLIFPTFTMHEYSTFFIIKQQRVACQPDFVSHVLISISKEIIIFSYSAASQLARFEYDQAGEAKLHKGNQL